MAPISILRNILLAVFQTGVDVNNLPVYIAPARLQIENQQNIIAPLKDLMIVLREKSPSMQIATDKQLTDIVGGGLTETISTSYRSIITIELISQNTSALELKDNLMPYLNSYVSRDMQNANGINIAEITPTDPTSITEVEGSDRIYRFLFDVALFYAKVITFNVPYYDKNFIPQIITNE
jgi:hypothetical protein